jgi:hypothetical protein
MTVSCVARSSPMRPKPARAEPDYNRAKRTRISATTPTLDRRCTARHRRLSPRSRRLRTPQQQSGSRTSSTTAGTASKIGNAAPASGQATADSGRKGGLPGIAQPVIGASGHWSRVLAAATVPANVVRSIPFSPEQSRQIWLRSRAGSASDSMYTTVTAILRF